MFMEEKRRITIIDSDPGIIEFLQDLFQSEGYTTQTANIREIKTGEVNFESFIREFDPNVVLYDVGFPFKQNWDYFKSLRENEIMKDRRTVITTTNKRALDELVGEDTHAMEIIGKPFDIENMINAVEGKPQIHGEKEY